MSEQAGNKQIKLSVALEGGSFEQAKRALRELTKLAGDFARELNKASLAGSLFGGASTRTLGSGMPGITTPGAGAPRNAGAAMAVNANPLTAAVQANKSLLQSTATDSKAAFKIMTDGLRGAIREQTQDIDRLQQKLRGLNETYAKLQQNSKGAFAAGQGYSASNQFRQGMMGNLQAEILNTNAELTGATATRAQLEGMEGPNAFAGIFGRGRGARRRYAAAMQYNSAGEFEEYNEFAGTLKPSSGFGGFMRGLGYSGTGLGGGLGGLARAAAPGLAIAGGYEMLHAMQMQRDSTVADYTLWNGMQRQGRAAAVNQAYGGMGMQIKGDVNMALAASNLSPTDISGAIGKEQMSALLTQAYQKAKATGSLGDVKEQAQDWAARMFDASEENLSAKDATVRQMALDQATANMGPEAAQRLQQQLTNKYQAQNLQDQADRSFFQSSYGNRMAQMRMFGSNKMRQFGGLGYANAAATSGVGTLYQSEEINPMIASLRSSVGSRYAGSGTAAQMLTYQYAGLGNATQLAGISQGYGNGFFRGFTGGIGGGRGMVDVAAAQGIGAMYQQGMYGGDFFTGGGGAEGAQGFMSVAGAMGGDLRASRAGEAGYQQLSSYMGGNIDRLQRGINVLASVTAAPGSLYTQEALRDMSPAQRMDVMRKIASGAIRKDTDLPLELQRQGVTIANLKAYGGAQDKFLFSRFMSKQADPAVAAQVASFREKGWASLKGLNNQDRRAAFLNLAIAGRHSGLGNTVDQARAALMQRAAMESPELFKALQGGGLGDAASDTAEAAMKLQGADTETTRQNVNLASGGQAEKAVSVAGKPAQDAAAAMVKLGQNFDVAATAVANQLRGLADDLAAARQAIRSGNTMPARTKTKAKGE